MAANPDEPHPPSANSIAAERLVLIFGLVAFPALAIALGICITILANAFR
jgi:hypothetical protein